MIEGERKLATIRRIADIEPIEGADRIVKATIDGWELVTQKGNYQPGDLALYFEIDSFLPVREEFEFLRKSCFKNHSELGEGFRIKTIKLKGQVSQGLSLPLSDFFNLDCGRWYYERPVDETGICYDSIQVFLEEGTDVTEFFGVKKWEKPAIGPGGNSFGPSNSRGNFPSFIPKTDQERIQNCWGGVKKWIYFAGSDVEEIKDAAYITLLETEAIPSAYGITYFKNDDHWFKRTLKPNEDEVVAFRSLFEATIKLDGSSMTVYYDEGQLGVCSRNLDLKRMEGNVFWDTAVRSHVLGALAQMGRNVAIQGELMGPGVQGNRENLKTNKLFVFDVYDIDARRYMTPRERGSFMDFLFSYLDFEESEPYIGEVPVISIIILDGGMEVSDFLAMAERQSSINHAVAEGIVFKSREPGGPTFKVISNKFLLAEKD